MICSNLQVINVPIPDDDIIKTVSCLPRTSKNDGRITIRVKRKLSYKKVEKEEIVNRDQLKEGLRFLKNNHPSYKNMSENNDENKDDTSDSDSDPNSDEESSDSEADHEAENDNDYLETTCMLPENPQTNVIVNNTSEVMRKKLKNKSKITHEVAP